MTPFCLAIERKSAETEKLLKTMGSDMNNIDEVSETQAIRTDGEMKRERKKGNEGERGRDKRERGRDIWGREGRIKARKDKNSNRASERWESLIREQNGGLLMRFHAFPSF